MYVGMYIRRVTCDYSVGFLLFIFLKEFASAPSRLCKVSRSRNTGDRSLSIGTMRGHWRGTFVPLTTIKMDRDRALRSLRSIVASLRFCL